jgi:hypothetical protein
MPEQPTTSHGSANTLKDEFELLEILRLLVHTKKARTTADLLRYATQYGAPEVEERLRVLDAEGVSMPLAFDAVSVQLRLGAHRKNSALLAECRGKKVGLILPLPPELLRLFIPVADVDFLLPDDSAKHGPPLEFTAAIIKGARACRAKASEMQALVFESFREGRTLYVDMAVSDLLEPKLLPAGTRLISHLRPHRNPRDVALPTTSTVSFI